MHFRYILWWKSNCLCSSSFLKEGQALMAAWGGGITWLLMITMLSNLLAPLQRWTINVPCMSTKSKWRRSALPKTTSQLSLVAFNHYFNKEMKKCHAREKLATLSGQYFLTCEEERGVTCKSVISFHDLHSKLKIETCKMYSIVFPWNFVVEKNSSLKDGTCTHLDMSNRNWGNQAQLKQRCSFCSVGSAIFLHGNRP